MKNIIFKWFRRYRLHVLLWLLFISYESIVIGLITGVFGNPITYVTHYTLILFLFYIHSGLSLPWALKSNQSLFWRLPLIILFEIIAFDLTSFFLDKLLNIVHVLNSKDFSLTYQYTLSSLYRGIYFMGFSTGYYFIVRFNREKRLTNKLEKRRLNDIIIQQKSAQELTKAQNAFLKAQINPHLLFNTLDYIYHNIVSSSSP